jgi:hypothetical protein
MLNAERNRNRKVGKKFFVNQSPVAILAVGVCGSLLSSLSLSLLLLLLLSLLSLLIVIVLMAGQGREGQAIEGKVRQGKTGSLGLDRAGQEGSTAEAN